MKKRVKVFEAGKYPQGEFSDDRVKSIFGNVKEKIQGIFAHTSKWKEGEPLSLGEFSNFSVENGKAYADLELNEKGQSYYNDGTIKGISAEIGKGLSKIALLPIGVNPAIAGAEFSEYENVIMEFEEMKEEGETMTLEKILEAMKALPLEDRLALIRNIAQSITPDQKAAFRAVQYEFAEAVKEEAKQMTDQEFEEKLAEKLKEKEAELKAEFEAKEKAKSELMEFEAIVDKKILPAHKQAYILAFKANQGNSEILEFEEGKMTAKENLKKKVEGMGDITLTAEFAKAQNTKKLTETEEAIKRMEDAKKRAEGGN